MIASFLFLFIFVAFALCQAALTIKFADFLSPNDRAENATTSAGRPIGTAKLA